MGGVVETESISTVIALPSATRVEGLAATLFKSDVVPLAIDGLVENLVEPSSLISNIVALVVPALLTRASVARI